MIEQLEKLEQILINSNISVLKYLNEGMKNDELTSIINNYYSIKKIPDDINTILKWHNGTNINYQLNAEEFFLFPTFVLLSTESIKEILQKEYFNFMEKNMLPIFSVGLEEFLTINLKEKNNSKVYILQYWHSACEEYIPIYDNISSLFETIIQSYNKKIFYKDKFLDMDFDKSWEFSKIMNPKSKFWKQK